MVIAIKNWFLKMKETVLNLYKKYRESKFGSFMGKYFAKGNRRFVLCLYLIALGVFGATLLTNRLVISLYGDFKLQEIPFYFNGYDDWWSTILKGEFAMWDDSGFLGQNNIGTNTFYYLWNIFFLPTLLVPRALVPNALAFLIMTKFVLSGYVMKLLLNKHNVSERSSKIVATAYAFCGWSFYYLWFNHFLEIAVLFPWVLLGIEKVLKDKKVGTLTIALFISALTNYFFFIMFCFCGVIYALFRYFQLWSTYTGKERGLVIGLGIASFAIAILMATIILVPTFKVAMQSSRADVSGSNSYISQLKDSLKAILASMKHEEGSKSFWESFKTFWDLCFKFQGSDATKDNLYPIISYFFAPYSCFDSPLFANNGYDNTNCSLFMYTPLTLMMIPSIIQSIKEKKISHIIGVLGSLIMIFSPFFYYCFTGFTTVCYGRWQLFIVAIACIYIAINLDKIKEMKGWYFDISIVVCLFIEVLMILLAIKYQGSMSTKEIFTKNSINDRFICAMFQPAYILILYILVRNGFKHKRFGGRLNFALICEIIFVGNMVVLAQGVAPYDELYGGLNDVRSSTQLISKINNTDKTYYRIFNTSADRDSNNLGMVENYRGLGTFHSMYNYSLDEFGEWSRITYTPSSSSWRPWSMGVHEKRANLDTFLGVKYYLVNANDSRIVTSDTMIELDSGKWKLNNSVTSVNAFTSSNVTKDSGEYVIKSMILKSTNGNMDVYTVAFETNTDDDSNKVKTYNITISNQEPIVITVGANGNWYFNTLDIGVKGCPSSLTDTSHHSIKMFQRLQSESGNAVFNFTFTNNESAQTIINKGEDTNIPFGYKEIDRDQYNVVYENENFINLGFALDSLTDKEFINSVDYFENSTYSGKTLFNEASYTRTAILAKEDIDEISEAYPNKFVLNTTRDKSPYKLNEYKDIIKVYNIDNSYIDVYLQNWNHEAGYTTNYSSPVKYPADSIKQLYWNSYMDVNLSSYDVASEAKSRGGAFVTVNARMGENLMVTLYGINESGNEYELTHDIHMKHNYDKGSDWKYERGFYVDDRVTRIVVRAYDTFAQGRRFAKPNITVQYYDTYKAHIDELKQNSLKDVVVKQNGFTFDTKFTETKMEVLTIPYDEGWSLTRIDSKGNKEKVKLYKAQGGFNSFVAEQGAYSYSLDYVTPGLQTGILGFGVGLTLFSLLYVSFDVVFDEKRRLKEAVRV